MADEAFAFEFSEHSQWLLDRSLRRFRKSADPKIDHIQSVEPESVKRLARSVCSIIQRLLPSYASKTLDEGFFRFGVRLWRLTPQLHLSQERRPFKRGRRSRWGQFVRRLFRFCLATEQTD